jgi:hypothetical protein
MPFAVILLILKGLAIVHVIRTGRELWWILLILFLPGIGLLIYFLLEVLPSLNQNLTTRRAMRRVQSAVDPERGVREARVEYQRNPSVDTATRLADELTQTGGCEEAVRILSDARTGLFEDDPKLLLSLAKAQFAAGRHEAAIATLDHMRETNPGFRSPEGHLMYARALEGSGKPEAALEEYAALARYYPGAEARVRHALLQKKLGRPDRARELFADILKDARLAPKHFRKSQREWIELAERESAELLPRSEGG